MIIDHLTLASSFSSTSVWRGRECLGSSLVKIALGCSSSDSLSDGGSLIHASKSRLHKQTIYSSRLERKWSSFRSEIQSHYVIIFNSCLNVCAFLIYWDNSPFRNRHFLLCLGGYRVKFSSKQCTDFLCYFYILLLQFLDVLDKLQDARCLQMWQSETNT